MIRVALAASLVAFSFGAFGQTACMPREQMVKTLEEQYREVPVHRAIMQAGVVEVFVSPDGATWTIAIARPDGLSCLAASGVEWQAVPLSAPAVPGRGA